MGGTKQEHIALRAPRAYLVVGVAPQYGGLGSYGRARGKVMMVVSAAQFEELVAQLNNKLCMVIAEFGASHDFEPVQSCESTCEIVDNVSRTALALHFDVTVGEFPLPSTSSVTAVPMHVLLNASA